MSNQEKEILKLSVIKLKDAFVVSETTPKGYSSEASKLNNKLINGVDLKKTNHRDWFLSKSYPRSVQEYRKHPNINYRFELKDPTVQSNKIPLVLTLEEVGIEYTYEDWENYRDLYSLYELVSDSQLDTIEEIDFEIESEIEINAALKDFTIDFDYKALDNKNICRIKPENIQHQILDKIIFPEFLLAIKPSKLSSKDSYQIIRQYVKDNIDNRYAVITSDYAFCFTVEKKIRMVEPEAYQHNVNAYNPRARKAKYETRYRTDRRVKVFEMTYSPENYKGYTPIPGFYGKTHKELKKNIDKYLKELIEKINEPLIDCPYCKGLGVTINEDKTDTCNK